MTNIIVFRKIGLFLRVSVLFVALCPQVFGQYPFAKEDTLRGQKSFDPNINLMAEFPEGLISESFLTEASEAFSSTLESNGIITSADAFNILDCDIKAVEVGDQIVFTYALLYYRYIEDDLYPLLFETGNFFIEVIEKSSFSAGLVANACLEDFLVFWHEQNPQLPASRRNPI